MVLKEEVRLGTSMTDERRGGRSSFGIVSENSFCSSLVSRQPSVSTDHTRILGRIEVLYNLYGVVPLSDHGQS